MMTRPRRDLDQTASTCFEQRGPLGPCCATRVERAERGREIPEPSLGARLGQIGVLGWIIVIPMLLALFARALARSDLADECLLLRKLADGWRGNRILVGLEMDAREGLMIAPDLTLAARRSPWFDRRLPRGPVSLLLALVEHAPADGRTRGQGRSLLQLARLAVAATHIGDTGLVRRRSRSSPGRSAFSLARRLLLQRFGESR